MSADDDTLPLAGSAQPRIAALVQGAAKGFLAEIRTNLRAAAGIFAIALLIAGYGLLHLDAAVDAMRRSYVDKQLYLERLLASAAQEGWQDRARQSAKLRSALEQRLWTGDSEGVVRANVEDWINRIGRAAGLDKLRVRIEVAKPQGLPDDLRRVMATITAVQSEPTMLRFLYRIARDSHLLVVEHLHVATRPIAMLEMTLSTYARLTRSPSAGDNRGREGDAAVPLTR